MAHSSWGPGWPNCQHNKIRTLVRGDGLKFPCRVEATELFSLLIDETERLGYDVKPGQTWGMSCRAIRGSSRPSNHSWGLAIDINAPENPMGPRNGKIRQHPRVIAAWKKYGFRWGGDYSGRADDMHFEYMGSTGDMQRHTAQARQELQGGAPAPTPPPVPTRRPYPTSGGPFKKGSRGEPVRFIQGQLNRTNLEPKLPVTGNFLDQTDRAVRGFQGAVRIKQDGVVGPVTWQKLAQF